MGSLEERKCRNHSSWLASNSKRCSNCRLNEIDIRSFFSLSPACPSVSVWCQLLLYATWWVSCKQKIPKFLLTTLALSDTRFYCNHWPHWLHLGWSLSCFLRMWPRVWPVVHFQGSVLSKDYYIPSSQIMWGFFTKMPHTNWIPVFLQTIHYIQWYHCPIHPLLAQTKKM